MRPGPRVVNFGPLVRVALAVVADFRPLVARPKAQAPRPKAQAEKIMAPEPKQLRQKQANIG